MIISRAGQFRSQEVFTLNIGLNMNSHAGDCSYGNNISLYMWHPVSIIQMVFNETHYIMNYVFMKYNIYYKSMYLYQIWIYKRQTDLRFKSLTAWAHDRSRRAPRWISSLLGPSLSETHYRLFFSSKSVTVFRTISISIYWKTSKSSYNVLTGD